MRDVVKGGIAAVALALAAMAVPSPAAAHCDSLDGPVVKAAQAALASGDLAKVLVWVQPGDEREIREAFARTTAVRAAGGPAAELADRWFFETVVRVHRAGEGAPYTGLKPAGYQPAAGIAAADRALEAGSGEQLTRQVATEIASALEERYRVVRALAAYDAADVAAGRAYVHAYVAFIHQVEALHELLLGSGGAHAVGEQH